MNIRAEYTIYVRNSFFLFFPTQTDYRQMNIIWYVTLSSCFKCVMRKRVRLVIAILFFLDMWYIVVFFPIVLGTILVSSLGTPLYIAPICGFPIVQWIRCQVGLNLAKSYGNATIIGLSLLNAPVFVILMHYWSIGKKFSPACIIEFCLCFFQCAAILALYFRLNRWSACSVISILRLLVVSASFGILILAVITV